MWEVWLRENKFRLRFTLYAVNVLHHNPHREIRRLEIVLTPFPTFAATHLLWLHTLWKFLRLTFMLECRKSLMGGKVTPFLSVDELKRVFTEESVFFVFYHLWRFVGMNTPLSERGVSFREAPEAEWVISEQMRRLSVSEDGGQTAALRCRLKGQGVRWSNRPDRAQNAVALRLLHVFCSSSHSCPLVCEASI